MTRSISVLPMAPAESRHGIYANRTVIFIDLFFATTTLIHSFKQIHEAHVAADSKEFIDLAKGHHGEAILATETVLYQEHLRDNAEAKDLRILKSTPLNVGKGMGEGRKLVLWSSRGTPGIIASEKSKITLIGAMANIDSLTDHILRTHASDDILIACAGSRTCPAIEDLWCAGAYVEALMAKSPRMAISLDLPSRSSLDLFRSNTPDQIIEKSPVGQLAIKRGDGEEVGFSVKKNTSIAIPFLSNGRTIRSIEDIHQFPQTGN